MRKYHPTTLNVKKTVWSYLFRKLRQEFFRVIFCLESDPVIDLSRDRFPILREVDGSGIDSATKFVHRLPYKLSNEKQV